jgi:hypothetical protein
MSLLQIGYGRFGSYAVLEFVAQARGLPIPVSQSATQANCSQPDEPEYERSTLDN